MFYDLFNAIDIWNMMLRTESGTCRLIPDCVLLTTACLVILLFYFGTFYIFSVNNARAKKLQRNITLTLTPGQMVSKPAAPARNEDILSQLFGDEHFTPRVFVMDLSVTKS